MIKKIEKEINELKDYILENEKKQEKAFELLDNANNQMKEIQKKLQDLQIENQDFNEKLQTLIIVEDYLKKAEDKTNE